MGGGMMGGGGERQLITAGTPPAAVQSRPDQGSHQSNGGRLLTGRSYRTVTGPCAGQRSSGDGQRGRSLQGHEISTDSYRLRVPPWAKMA